MTLVAKLASRPRTMGFSDKTGLGLRVVRENLCMQNIPLAAEKFD